MLGKKYTSGISIPEVTITLVVLTVLIIVMVSTFSFSQIAVMKQGMRRAALHLAKSELEKKLGNSWNVLSVGHSDSTIRVGEAVYDVDYDIGQYTYSYGSYMSKVSGSPAILPAKIENIPFDSDWWDSSTTPTIRFKLVRITITYGPNKDKLYLQQLITENWRV